MAVYLPIYLSTYLNIGLLIYLPTYIRLSLATARFWAMIKKNWLNASQCMQNAGTEIII